jgi:DNA-binding GntR family transcriptional regulator
MSTPALRIHQPEAAEARSLSDRAYFELRERIVTLELAPGTVLNERELMAEHGLGRTPVREALRRLAREKLVDVYPRRGMFVSSVEVRDLAGLSEVRAVLERSAARLAAERATAAERRELDTLLAELDRAADERDERSLLDLDQRIHRHIYAMTQNPFLAETLDEYYVLTLRIWFLALDRVERLDEAVHEHRRLLEAVRDGDADAAEQAMQAHVAGFERAIRAVL